MSVSSDSWDDDPRLTGEHVRVVASADGAVTLVGVVHDHPASKYRVREIVAGAGADVLALELPPLALPLFEQYAADGRVPPALGGEMSAAIQASTGERVVGIDGPSARYLWRLTARLVRERPDPRAVWTITTNLLSVSKATLARGLASAVNRFSPFGIELDEPSHYETDWSDDPERQAADEARQLGRAESVSNLLEHARGERVRDETREAHMAARLARLRREGDVVAVVGRGHLDQVTERLVAATRR